MQPPETELITGMNKKNNQYNDQYYSYQKGGKKQSRNQEFTDVYSNHNGRKPKNPRGRSNVVPAKKQRRGIGTIIAVFLIFIFVAVVLFALQLMTKVNTNEIPKSDDALGIMPGASYGSKVTNIALFGLDDRTNTFKGRSDVIMVLSVDKKHDKIKMTSILRDSLVHIDGYGEDKLNHAYSYGGAELAIKTLNQNFNLDIKNYVTVNFNNMAGIVDAVGGIDLTITEGEMNEINRNLDMLVAEEAEIEVKDTDYIYENGDVHLNGMQAVAFARIRILDSDSERAVRQQKVMGGVMDSVKSTSVFGYPGLLNAILPMCETSMDMPAVLGVAPIMLTNFTMDSLSIPGSAENAADGYTDAGNWVYVYDRDYAAKHIDAFVKEDDSEYWYEFY